MNTEIVSLSKQIDVSDFVSQAGVEFGFEIDPRSAYPAVIKLIKQLIENADTDIPSGFEMLFQSAILLDDRAWHLAADSESVDKVDLSPEDRNLRAQALEISRRWITEALHQSVDFKPMYLRIVPVSSWTL